MSGLEKAIAKTGILKRKNALLSLSLRRKDPRFMILTNSGGLFYAKGVAQEFDGLKNVLQINRNTDIKIERSGNQGDLVITVRGPKNQPVELEGMGDDETYAWGRAMIEVQELIGCINGDPLAAQPRPLAGLKSGAQGWYLDPMGRMAYYELNRVGMWQVREKREYDEDTVLRSMEEARLHDARRQGYVQPTSGQPIGSPGYPRDDERVKTFMLAKANAHGNLADHEMEGLEARGMMAVGQGGMVSPVPAGTWPPAVAATAAPPMTMMTALPPEYVQQQQQQQQMAAVAAAAGGHRIAAHRGNLVGSPVPMSVMGGVLPHDGTVAVPGIGPVPIPRGGGMVGPGVPVGGYVADVPTMMPSTFAVEKGGDFDDGDSLVLRRGGYAEEGGGQVGVMAGAGAGAGAVAGTGTGGGRRWGRSPAMELLQG